MTSSGSSSRRSSALALALLPVLAALALGACRTPRPAPPPPPLPQVPGAEAWTPPRLALFPLQNLTGEGAPVKELTWALRDRLMREGIDLVSEESVYKVLAARRVRYMGGIDRETAAALRDELGVQGILIASLEAWFPADPFRISLTMRLVAVDGEPVIRWIDSAARGGGDFPGPLSVGILTSMDQLRGLAFDQLATSLAATLRRPARATACPSVSSRMPNRQFHAQLLTDPERQTIAVLPFVNQSGRRDAGDVMALRFLAPLVNSGTIHVVEPGVVRGEMLAYRLGATGGISVDDAQVILGLVGADLVLSGTVRAFEDSAGAFGAPRVDFSAWVLDFVTGKLAWASTSSGSGDDGVFLFDLGRVTTANALACGMAKGTAELLLRNRSPVQGDRPTARLRRRGEGGAPSAHK